MAPKTLMAEILPDPEPPIHLDPRARAEERLRRMKAAAQPLVAQGASGENVKG